MALTLSAVVLFGVLTFVLLRGRHVGVGSALVLFLFGFFVAGTGAQSAIYAACRSAAHFLTNITS